jgi:hypothetical protein
MKFVKGLRQGGFTLSETGLPATANNKPCAERLEKKR